jgi:hypothetical protein
MADLTNPAPQSSYFGLMNTSSYNGLTNVLQQIQDGLGRPTPLFLSQIGIDISTTMGAGLSIDGIVLTSTATQINLVCVDASFASFTTALTLPAGTTAQRPITPTNGDLRYNSTSQSGELYAAGSWMTLNAGNPSGYYPGGPTYIQDTYGDSTYNLSVGTPAQVMNSRVQCTLFGDSVLQVDSNGSNLCAYGYQSLMLNSEGNNNSSYGHMSGKSITFGSNNSFFGKSSGQSLVAADNSSFFGSESGFLSQGDNNAIYGALAGRNNILGTRNSFFGSNASVNSATGSDCCSYGYESLRSNDSNEISAYGSRSIYSNISGNLLDAFGCKALYSNVFGNENSAFSNRSLYNNIEGDFNCGFGPQSIYSNLEGDSICGFGYQSLYANLVSGNCGFGYSAGSSNTTGTIDAFGYNSLSDNTIGPSNSAFSRNSLANNISGGFNCAFGEDSLRTHTDKSYNSAFGYAAAKFSIGNGISAYGYNSLLNNQGDYNSAYGFSSLTSNLSGNFNTGVGASCLDSNLSGNFNTGIGSYALTDIISTDSNTAIGTYSLYVLNHASNATSNTAVGCQSGYSITSGSFNSFLGFNTTASTNPENLTGCTLLGAESIVSTGLTNATAIGYQSSVTSSDTIVLGKVGTNVAIGKTSAAFPLDVVGISVFKGITSGYTSTGVLKGQSGFSTAGATTATIDYPLATSGPNMRNVRINISVINGTGDKSAYSQSNAAAFYNNGAVTASTGTLPIITMIPTAGYAPLAAWSISGNNLRLSLTGVAASTEIWVVSYEYFSTFNTAA